MIVATALVTRARALALLVAFGALVVTKLQIAASVEIVWAAF